MEHSKVFVFTANLDYYKPSFCFSKFQSNRTAEIQRAGLAGKTDIPPASIFNQHICFSSEGYPLTLFFLCIKNQNPKVQKWRELEV